MLRQKLCRSRRCGAPAACALLTFGIFIHPPAARAADERALPRTPSEQALKKRGRERGSEPPRRKPTVLGEVVVRGKRDEPTTGAADPAVFASVIRPAQERAVSLPDLLRHSAGIDVKGFGSLGRFATVSIRGSTSEQVQVFLDGVLLNRAASGMVNLADLPLPQLSRIEVYRGLAPARFGSASPGGVVNLVSEGAGKAPRTIFSSSFGSFSTADFSLSHSSPFAGGSFVFSAYGSRSNGDFLFRDNNGTPLNPLDDETVRRRNNAFGGGGGMLKTAFELSPGVRLRATVEGMARVQGVPGIDALQTENARFETSRVLGKLDYEHRGLGPWGLSLFASTFVTRGIDEYRDPAGEMGLGPRQVRTTSLTPGMTVRLAAFPSRHHALQFLVEYRHDRATSSTLSLGRTTAITMRRHAVAVSAEDQISLWDGRLVLGPSLRVDTLQSGYSGRLELSDTQVQLAGKLGLRVRLTDGLALRGNVGRFFRAPTLTELFGDSGVVRGNPQLRPELGYTFDAGFTFRRRLGAQVRSLLAEAVYFQTHFTDLIVFLINGQGLALAENQSAAIVRGVELTAGIDLAFGLTLRGAYTYQRAVSESDDRSRGKLLPGRPQHKVSSRVGFTWRDWRWFYELLVIDGNFTDRQNLVELDARVLHGAGLSWRALPAVTFTLEVQNFTDNRAVDLYRFPLPGRSVFGKMLARF